MKILQVNKLYHPWIGGIETIVQEIAEWLNGKDEFEIEVLVCNHKLKRVIEEINGVKVFRASSFGIYLGMPVSFDFFYLYRKLYKNYDLVFLHFPFPLGFVAYTLLSSKKDLVIWYHSDIVRQKFLEIIFKPFHLFALKKAKKIFVSNPNLIESSNYLKKFKEKCIVIPFGVNLEKFKLNEKTKEEVEEIIKRYKPPIVLSVGRYVYYKGFEYLIESAKNVGARFLIIGEGPLKKKYENIIKKFNLENKVFLIPPVENLIPYYYACDLFVLPSITKSEAFGIVLLEAMACGKSLISTNIGTGTNFINQDGITGFVIEPRNSKILSEKINEVLNNKELKEKFSQNSLRRVQEFSKEKFIEKLSKELKNL
jgi:glycosyltransferase involved in cell wall biosynthesis